MSLDKLFLKLKGGPGSGNFYHAGNPPNKGGSSPSKGYAPRFKTIAVATHSYLPTNMTFVVKRQYDSQDDALSELSQFEEYYHVVEGIGDSKGWFIGAPIGKRIVRPDFIDEPKGEVNFNKWAKNLSSKEVAALQAYRGAEDLDIDTGFNVNSTSINGTLRGTLGLSEKSKREVAVVSKLLDSSISKGSLGKDTIVYRGIDDDFFRKLSPGTTIKNNGYTSTSLDKNIASTFGKVIQIKAKKGTNVAYLDAINDDLDEKELLFKRGLNIKIIEKSNGVLIGEFE